MMEAKYIISSKELLKLIRDKNAEVIIRDKQFDVETTLEMDD